VGGGGGGGGEWGFFLSTTLVSLPKKAFTMKINPYLF